MENLSHARPKSAPSDGTFSVGLTAAVIVPQDFNRESLVIAAPVGGDIFIGWSNKISVTNGIVLKVGAAPLVLSTLLHGGLVQYQIWAIAAAPATGYWSATSWHNCLADQRKQMYAT